MAENEKQVQPESAQAEEVQEEKSVLDQILEDGRMARDESQREWARDVIGEFVSQIMEGTMVISKDTEVMINARISQIDKLISMQLNEVMHNPELQKLEASWRGLHYLVHQSETGERLKIRVMNVSKKDLLKDMEKASEFDQSSLFKKIYEEEFGMFGGASYGALMGDYEFSNHPQDISLLEKISQVAAAAHAPLLRLSLLHLHSYLIGTDLLSLAVLVTWQRFSRVWNMPNGSHSVTRKMPGLWRWPFPMSLCVFLTVRPMFQLNLLTTKRMWMVQTTASISGAMRHMRLGHV
jgi:hypothetical protein